MNFIQQIGNFLNFINNAQRIVISPEVGQDLFAQSSRFFGVIQKISLGQQVEVKVFVGNQRFDKGAFSGLAWPEKEVTF